MPAEPEHPSPSSAETSRAMPLEALVSRAQAGDSEAVEALFRAHQRLIWHVLRRLVYPGQETEDLYQVGAMGLMKAIQRFDPTRGLQFATYAVPLILGEVRRFLRDDQPLHVARSLKERAQAVSRAQAELAQRLAREPSVREIADHLETTVDAVTEAIDSRQVLASLDAPVEDDEGPLMGERLAGPSDEEAWLARIALDQALARLSERERFILLRRFQAGETQTHIANRLGISQVQVSRLERQALARLRQQLDPDDVH